MGREAPEQDHEPIFAEVPGDATDAEPDAMAEDPYDRIAHALGAAPTGSGDR